MRLFGAAAALLLAQAASAAFASVSTFTAVSTAAATAPAAAVSTAPAYVSVLLEADGGAFLTGVSTSPVDVSDAAALKPLLDDQRLAGIAAGHPSASLRPIDPDVYDEKVRPGGGRRFVFEFALRSCSTCAELAGADVAFDFDGVRRSLGPRLLTVSDPPLFAVEGDVARGEDFSARIDAVRTFRLKAFSEGWVIEVQDDKGRDYCSVVTPPYSGTNHLEIFGWHFRNADNTGPNESGEKTAPWRRRSFRCVETAADFAGADKSLRLVLWPDKSTWEETDAASQLHDRLVFEADRGALILSRIELGNLGAGRRPWIESMHFRFELRPHGVPAP